jgi:hypothetical protein
VSAPGPRAEGTSPGRGRLRPEESLLRGGLRGVALVTLATAALAGAGALIALVVSLLY